MLARDTDPDIVDTFREDQCEATQRSAYHTIPDVPEDPPTLPMIPVAGWAEAEVVHR